MSYQVLYRKYRPDGFKSLIGQEHIVEILKNSIKEQKVAHAYLFSGPRGTGKTTTARILAKSINCLHPEDGNACLKCENCLSFVGNPDIIEIDAASNNGVDEIRELISNVKIMPTNYKYKVYIIDEVHMLSTSAFNALLLTLEEPPKHVVFILATTNLESVPITIVSRCQRFDFLKISNEDIAKRLEFVCQEENIKYTMDGLLEIAELADGGMRDALSLLDQLAKNDAEINLDLVTKEVGSISSEKIKELIEAVEDKDLEKLENVFTLIEKINLNYKVVVKKLVSFIAEKAADTLKNPDKAKMNFDEYKKIVMDLNDLLNKININVSPYLLIKMVLLEHMAVSLPKMDEKNILKSDAVKVVPGKNENKKEEIIAVSEEPVESKEFIDIRVNNCFVSASKKDLLYLKPKWDEFVKDVDDPPVKGLVVDTSLVAASSEYAIVEVEVLHKDSELNAEVQRIENLWQTYLENKVKLVFLSSKDWNKEKEEYIKKLKTGYKYEIMEEPIIENKNEVSEEDYISSVKEVFDIEKIEIE